jgi:hypothetical protein
MADLFDEFARKQGGMGLGSFEMVLALKQLARADQSFALSVMTGGGSGVGRLAETDPDIRETFHSWLLDIGWTSPMVSPWTPGLSAGFGAARGIRPDRIGVGGVDVEAVGLA